MSRPIAESVSLLSETLTNCKTNLTEKKVENVDSIKISDVDEKIAEIKAGGSGDSVTITVNYYYGESDGQPEGEFTLQSPDGSKTYSPTDMNVSSSSGSGDYNDWYFDLTFVIPKSDLEEPQILDLYFNGSRHLCNEVDSTGFSVKYDEYYACYDADTSERIGYLSKLKEHTYIKVGNKTETRISAAKVIWSKPCSVEGYTTGESFCPSYSSYNSYYMIFQTDPILVYSGYELVSCKLSTAPKSYIF